MKTKTYIPILLFGVILLVTSCSQKKNTALNRFYHNTNARWNGYFNAKEAYRGGTEKLANGHRDNYRERLPLFIYGDDDAANAIQGDMDVVIKKCSRVIEFHSMDIKGKEYCKWIDEAWMLIGKAYFYEKNYKECKPIFKYVHKKFKKTETKYEAQLWMIRTLFETEEMDRAENIIYVMNNDGDIPEKYMAEFKALAAEYSLRTGDVTKAIILLEEAIKWQKDKQIGTRWMFILAQLYAEEGETIRANEMYQAVVKRHPEYEMEFWAQMNRALAYTSDDGSAYDIKRVLLKMLRDEKNLEYRDKLYYALSEVYEAEGEEEKQIRALTLSTKTSVDDDYQKGLSFLTLAELYFDRPEYIPAQAYYDSTVQYIPDDFPDHAQIVNIQQSLKDLVEQMLIVQFEDSVQQLRNLSEDELEAYIDNIIDDRIAAEEEKRRLEEEQENAIPESSGFSGFDDPTAAKGKWYFYNDRNLQIGEAEFKKVWGNRANADDWRRSDKTSISPDDFADFNDSMGDSVMAGITDRTQYLKDIPFTDEALAESNKKIADAYYAMGNIYKENMQDIPAAIGAFRNLVSRFDTSEHHMNCYYRLYRMYYDLGRDSANYYKNYILYRYPNSDYAKIIKDPDYASKLTDKNKAVRDRYNKCYYYYSRGFYQACIDYVDKSMAKYPDNDYKLKFLYLKALSKGQGNKGELVASLKDFAGRHSGTDEAKDAQNKISILTAEKKVSEVKPPPPYSYEKNSKYLAVLLVPKSGHDISEIKKSVANYNKAYHAMKGLTVDEAIVMGDNYMIAIKQFSNELGAQDYYESFKGNHTSLKKINQQNFKFLIISYNNYAIFFKDNRPELYEEFMKKNYQL
ncbi:tetratricopeptide repeat protein [bacterium SCSIO 12741]|nr:tetratricopeptide repeat protein [bacterium SCSIO 12741]